MRPRRRPKSPAANTEHGWPSTRACVGVSDDASYHDMIAWSAIYGPEVAGVWNLEVYLILRDPRPAIQPVACGRHPGGLRNPAETDSPAIPSRRDQDCLLAGHDRDRPSLLCGLYHRPSRELPRPSQLSSLLETQTTVTVTGSLYHWKIGGEERERDMAESICSEFQKPTTLLIPLTRRTSFAYLTHHLANLDHARDGAREKRGSMEVVDGNTGGIRRRRRLKVCVVVPS